MEFIYPREFEIKETTETATSSSYLDCYLYIDNGNLTTRLYDKRDDFNFPIVNFPFLSSNIPSAPANGVYVSQLIRYARACSNYQDFMERGKVLTTKLVSQGFQKKQTGSNTLEVLLETSWSIWSVPTMWQFPNCFWCFCQWRAISRLPKSRTYNSTDISFVQAMVGEACLPSNAYYPRTPDYTLYSGVHVCSSEHSDSSFVFGFMSLDYGLSTMTATTFGHSCNMLSLLYCVLADSS